MLPHGNQFRTAINDSEYYEEFQSKLAEFEANGYERADAYRKAKAHVIFQEQGVVLEDRPQVDTELSGGDNLDLPPSRDMQENVLWVGDNLDGPIDWTTCPSRGARSLLKKVKTDRHFTRKFHESILPKALPNASDRENIFKRHDDGRDLKNLNAKIKNAVIEAELAERQERQNHGLELVEA